MILAVILIVIGMLFFLYRKEARKNEALFAEPKPNEGEVLGNKYIIEHEKKIKDDVEYEEYLEWCKFKGESPVEKQGFDEHRMKEFQMYKKLLKHGIGGL